MITFKTMAIIISVDKIIKAMFSKFKLLFTISVNNKVKFKKGTHDKIVLVSIFIIKAIILGKKEMKVSGVKAL